MELTPFWVATLKYTLNVVLFRWFIYSNNVYVAVHCKYHVYLKGSTFPEFCGKVL